MPRLFVAIDLPERLKKELTKIRGEIPGARWVKREQLHLTLRFIGEVDDDCFAAIKKELSKIEIDQFSLAVSGIGYFISRGKIKIIWAGIQVRQELKQLKKEIDRALSGLDISPEKRKFSPHVSLAKLKNSPFSKVKAYLDKYKPIEHPPFGVEEFYLYSSITSPPKGTVHHKEVSYGLRKAD